MNKKTLKSYCILRREKGQVELRISRLTKELRDMESGAAESDVVTKGKRGNKSLGTVTVTGFPDRRYQQLKRQRTNALDINRMMAEKISAQMYEVEEYINSVDDPEMRMILRTYCMSDKPLTWQQLANRLNTQGWMYTAESVRKRVERFLES